MSQLRVLFKCLFLLAATPSLANASPIDGMGWHWGSWMQAQTVKTTTAPLPNVDAPVPTTIVAPTTVAAPTTISPSNSATPGSTYLLPTGDAAGGPVGWNQVAASTGSGSMVGAATAFINMGSGPFAESSILTSGGALPWYESPVVSKFFGGVPTAAQQLAFQQAVVQDVAQTYHLANIPITITTNPNASAQHTISVVSGTSDPALPNAVGVTDVGHNGVSFIDKLGGETNLNQFEWVLAHNIAHELMHAIGGEHHDTTGAYLDGATTPWSTMINPAATFSPAAVQDIESHLSASSISTFSPDGQLLSGQPVPEPTTLAFGVMSCGFWACRALIRWSRSPIRRD